MSTWQKYKDKKGGLTAKAVAAYRKENPGSKLKTGVTGKPKNLAEKVRRARFWVRFYGQKDLPPLKKPNGKPTRLALANNRWRDDPPKSQEEAERKAVKTVSQARALASKGRKILAAYKKKKGKK